MTKPISAGIPNDPVNGEWGHSRDVETMRFYSRFITVTVTDGVPLEIGVAIVGGEGVDDMGTVVVNSAAAVGLCEFPCGEEVTLIVIGHIRHTHTLSETHSNVIK